MFHFSPFTSISDLRNPWSSLCLPVSASPSLPLSLSPSLHLSLSPSTPDGQTGSGKTYSMFGRRQDNKTRGIIPRSVETVFAEIAQDPEIEEVTIRCSFLEIYREMIYDLLRNSKDDKKAGFGVSKAKALRIRQTKDKGTYVQGLVEKYVYSPSDVLKLLRAGEKFRSTSATELNKNSSRSHSVFTISVSSCA
jgi:Kinesin motor domain